MNTTFRVCKVCSVEHERIRAGMFPNGKDPRFVNKEGREWNGNVCPDCHNTGLKQSQKLKRAKDKATREIVNAKRRERYRLTGK